MTVGDQILLLDDDPSILEVMRSHLARLGYSCAVETSPLRAVELLRRRTFGLLISDLRMPELDGMEVVRRAKDVDPDLAIVVVTAMLDLSTAIDAIHGGADDYIVKPFRLEELARATERALEKRSITIQNRQYQERLEARVREATEDLARVNTELRDTRQYLVNLLDSTVDAILTTDSANRIEYVNDGAQRMLGYAEGELMGMEVQQLYAGGANEVAHIRRKLREELTIRDHETEFVRQDGTKIPVNVSLSCLVGPEGHLTSILAICKDITRQKQLERELKELSSRDSLTGLYNQRSFYDRLAEEINRDTRQKRSLSLLLFDIDRFKTYNDSRGHLAGDRALQAAAHAIHESTRQHVDLGFRYGGDEFTVILPEAAGPQAEQIAQRILRSFEEQRLDQLTLSIGLCTFQPEFDLKSFIHLADAMMYEAKRAGGNRVCAYQPGMKIEMTASESIGS